jgi:hypothetical protein
VPKSKGSARAKRGTAKAPTQSSVDIENVMERFSQAISLVRVYHSSLAGKEHKDFGDEEEVLRQAVELLRLAYNELDMTVLHMWHSSTS